MARNAPNRIFDRASVTTVGEWSFAEYRCEVCGNMRTLTLRTAQGTPPLNRMLHCRRCAHKGA